MMSGNFYCLYDTLFEEYQNPFVMRNDNVALMEFNIFKASLKEKVKTEKEKQDIEKRYRLMKYDGITFNQADGFFLSKENSIPCYEIREAEDDE